MTHLTHLIVISGSVRQFNLTQNVRHVGDKKKQIIIIIIIFNYARTHVKYFYEYSSQKRGY